MRYLVVLLTMVLLILSACQQAPGRPAGELLPIMGGYRHVTGTDVTRMLDMASLRSTLALNPALAAKLWAINQLTTCAQKTGIVAYSGYYNVIQAEFGAAFVINQNRLTDPNYLFSCTEPSSENISVIPEIQPCAKIWQHREGDTTYHLMYVASTNSVCEQMCSEMAGCS